MWRKNFEIKEADYIMLSAALTDMLQFQKPTVSRDCLKQSIAIFKNGDNIASYLLIDELRDYIDNTLQAVIKSPERIIEIQNKNTEYNKKYFERIEEVEKLKYKKLSDQQLIKIFYELFELMKISHGYALGTTWFVDSDGEDLSNYLTNLIKKKIENNKLSLSVTEVFSILTTPEKESFAQKEEIEMLKILSIITTDKIANKIFCQENLKRIILQIRQRRHDLYDKIFRHYKKWCWTPYTYIGPAYNLDYYFGIFSSLVKQKIDFEQRIKSLLREKKGIAKRRKKLMEKLQFKKKEIVLFDLAAQIVWLKAFRKDILFYGMYINDKVLKELGHRHGFTLIQMKYIAGFEMKNFKKFTPEELERRFNLSVIYCNRGKQKIYTGKRAENFLNKQNFEKVEIKNVKELKGTPAFVGRAKGRVKIINLSKEMGKMNQDDIIVAHTTFPSLVPAMKKAAAIITDDGGITCHAVIVARELKIPCIVGTKIATTVLKDGDLVGVDANKGVIKILK